MKTEIPSSVRKALRCWQDSRDLVVELISEDASAVTSDERDCLLSAAEVLAVAVDRWLAPSPDTTGGAGR